MFKMSTMVKIYKGEKVNVIFTFNDNSPLSEKNYVTIEYSKGWRKEFGRSDEQKFMKSGRRYKYVKMSDFETT
ncbi:MAG: hypothetical protein V3S79_00900 [Candidatus Thermoplasmatota archaeon]